MGVICDGVDDDIRNRLKLISALDKYNRDCSNLTIIPTLDCNFRCTYCYEKDRIKPVYMTDETENALIEFIEQKSKGGKELRIQWFGGEPLLAYERIVSISRKINKLNINYESAIITNGYLLNLEKIELLKELKIDKIQITIDGMEETHNKRRPHLRDHKTYNTILNNIETLFDYTKSNNINIKLDIRINVDNQNKKEYSQSYKELKLRFPLAIVYPGIVKNDALTTDRCNNLSCAFSRKDTSEFYLEQYNTSAEVGLDYYPTWYGIAGCTATRFNDFVVGPQGEIYACWHNVGDDKMIMGNIHNGEVISNHILFTRFLEGIDPFENDKCKNCFYLPICGGGCPYDRILNKYYGQHIETCTMHKGKKTLEKMLEIHYEMKLKHKPENIGNITI
ncbi:MAG: radical SAM protein [Dehalococcoidia bacterium]|nr:radical SAM protein [Dehalococcoidia bacterium]